MGAFAGEYGALCAMAADVAEEGDRPNAGGTIRVARTERRAIVMPERTLDTDLDGLLIDWFHWTREYNLTRGMSKDQRTTGAYRTPGHMDWWNGASDAQSDRKQLQAFDQAVQRIPNDPDRPWRTCIEFLARNLAQRITVWYSPRLPPTREERDILIMEARTKLLQELRSAGVMGAR